MYAFLVHSFFGRVNKVFSRLFLLELLPLESADRAGYVLLQKDLSTHQINNLLDKRTDVTFGGIEKIINNDFIQWEAE